MKKLSILICYLIILCLSVTFTSCNKWFDVSSKTDMKEVDMFNYENGYFDALIGCYDILASKELYGSNLSLSYLEIMGCNYKITNNHPKSYIAASEYNYASTDISPIISQVWSQMYFAIANVNFLLQKLESADKRLFTDDNYNIIKGEALALRAYIHFDLMRMFSASKAADDGEKRMPYVTKFSIKNTPYSNTTELLSKVMQDIDASIILLANDPGMTVVNSSKNKYLLSRASRLNIHAVGALKARVALYSGDKDLAYKTATNIISTQAAYTLVTDPRICETNKLFSQELIFGLYIHNLGTITDNMYTSTNGFSHDNAVVEEIFDKKIYENQDVRLEFLFTYNDQLYRSIKFVQDAKAVSQSSYRIPMLRLSELYYIAAECAPDIETATTYITRMRTARRLPAVSFIDNDDLQNYLLKEYRREMYGEGQIFYQYKRHNLKQLPDCPVTLDKLQHSIYLLPIPDLEIEWGNK